MAIITDQPYHRGESVGMAVSLSSHIKRPALADHMRTFPLQVVVACGTLSLISVLGMFVILGVCPVPRANRA